MRIAIATVFPGLFEPFLDTGIVGRAVRSGLLEIGLHDIREHAVDERGSVDDYQFGGGAGMIMRPEPLFGTLESIAWHDDARLVLLTPQGRSLDHGTVLELATEGALVLFCGRYGGVDERFRAVVDDEISVCEAVVSGGEIPAMLLVDAVARWIPGALGRQASARTDSLATGLLDHPRYTRPASFRGVPVPGVLLSGDHAAIAEWRYERALERTRERRPDLLAGADPEALKRTFMELQVLADRSSSIDGTGKAKEEEKDG